MRRAIGLFCCIAFVSSPFSVRAHPDSPLPPRAVSIPFDYFDPSRMQAEVTQQITKFLLTLHTHWGKNQDAIRHIVTGDVERADGKVLVFARTLSDHTVLEGYEFQEGSLVRGQFVFLQQPVNGLNEFIDCYTAIKQSLTISYGFPDQDLVIWDNDLYQPLPDYWGVAVQLGHVRFAARWKTLDGTITIRLTGNQRSRLFLEYTTGRQEA